MAISKTQNERPAINALIDVVNALDVDNTENRQDIATLKNQDVELSNSIRLGVAGLQEQLGDGFSADLSVTQSYGAMTQAIQIISDEIGDGFSADETISQALSTVGDAVLSLADWQSRFRLGLTERFTIGGNESQSSSIAFDTPFADDAEVAVFLVCVDGAEILTSLECKLISATYSGFSWSVNNASEDSVSVKVGFVAVRLN